MAWCHSADCQYYLVFDLELSEEGAAFKLSWRCLTHVFCHSYAVNELSPLGYAFALLVKNSKGVSVHAKFIGFTYPLLMDLNFSSKLSNLLIHSLSYMTHFFKLSSLIIRGQR